MNRYKTLNSSNKGQLFIISAPSGAGKTSLVQELIERVKGIRRSVSYTTRPKRAGEEEGVHYHFVTQSQFEKMREEELFLESAHVFGNYYGTSRAWVESTVEKGNDVVFEIDWQGAQSIRAQWEDTTSVFILPPSEAALSQRLSQRAQDSHEVIAHRLQQAHKEIAHYHEYDYLIINDTFEHALSELIIIVEAARLKRTVQQHKHAALLNELLTN